MSELKDAKLLRSSVTGRWVVNLLWRDGDGIWTQSHKEFDSQRQAMGFCECYGWRQPLSMWQSAVENEPAEDPADNMVLEPTL